MTASRKTRGQKELADRQAITGLNRSSGVDGDNYVRYSPAMPDFKWINREIPILEVAQKLGVEVRDKKAICQDCGKRRLTFTTVLNGWQCWACNRAGKMRSVIDLVMEYRNVTSYEAAKWISKNWRVAGRVQIERSRNARGSESRTFQRYRPMRVADRSKPSIEAFVASPGWMSMPKSTRLIAITLLAMTDMSDRTTATVSVSRRALGVKAGVHKSATIARSIRELESIGLFAVDRGSWGNRGYKPSTFRLTWWSNAFQEWLSRGYAKTPLKAPHHQRSTSNSETLGTHPAPDQNQEPVTHRAGNDSHELSTTHPDSEVKGALRLAS